MKMDRTVGGVIGSCMSWRVVFLWYGSVPGVVLSPERISCDILLYQNLTFNVISCCHQAGSILACAIQSKLSYILKLNIL